MQLRAGHKSPPLHPPLPLCRLTSECGRKILRSVRRDHTRGSHFSRSFGSHATCRKTAADERRHTEGTGAVRRRTRNRCASTSATKRTHQEHMSWQQETRATPHAFVRRCNPHPHHPKRGLRESECLADRACLFRSRGWKGVGCSWAAVAAEGNSAFALRSPQRPNVRQAASEEALHRQT